jgi:probable F420-dependent oxidoreductase
MKFGLRYVNTGRYADPAQAVALMQAAEAAGFDSAWTVEHVVVPGGYGSEYPYAPGGRMPGEESRFVLPDPLIWMAYVAARTERIRLATGVIILPEHNPVLCAKQVATLDVMSGGRMILGVGVGWLKEEFEALGVPFETRGAMTDEYIEAMRALWTQEAPCFEGRFVRFKDAFMRPKPVNGAVPIVVAGHAKAAARRAGRLGDGFFPARGAPVELVQLARETARAHGRDPGGIEITLGVPEDEATIPELARMGVARLLVPVTGAAGIAARVRGPDDLLAWRGLIERYTG